MEPASQLELILFQSVGHLLFEGNLSHLEKGSTLQLSRAGHHFAKLHYLTEMVCEMPTNCYEI